MGRILSPASAGPRRASGLHGDLGIAGSSAPREDTLRQSCASRVRQCRLARQPHSSRKAGREARRQLHDQSSHCRKAKASEARGPAPGSARGWFQPELRQHPAHPGLGPQGHRGEGDFGWLWPPCSLGTRAPTTRQASTQRHKRRRLAVWGINSRVRECSPMKGLGPLAQVTSKAVAVTPPGSVALPPKPPVMSSWCPECG